jgi:hypothetical protein
VTCYIVLMNCLIDMPNDICVLSEYGVIGQWSPMLGN